MNQYRVVWTCCLAFLTLPLLCSAQSELRRNDLPASAASSMVSARELKIPDKAIRAFNKGTEFLAARESARSIPEFEKAIKAFPGFYEAYYKLGIAKLDLQRSAEAQAAFSKSIELSDAHFAPAYFALGLALCNEKPPSASDWAWILTMRPGTLQWRGRCSPGPGWRKRRRAPG
jgi:tetratricopeptide (TPR) repeat protein